MYLHQKVVISANKSWNWTFLSLSLFDIDKSAKKVNTGKMFIQKICRTGIFVLSGLILVIEGAACVCLMEHLETLYIYFAEHTLIILPQH